MAVMKPYVICESDFRTPKIQLACIQDFVSQVLVIACGKGRRLSAGSCLSEMGLGSIETHCWLQWFQWRAAHVEVQYHVGMGTAGRLVASLAAKKTG